jgi:hypothetical protein
MSIAFGPKPETKIGGGASGSVKMRAFFDYVMGAAVTYRIAAPESAHDLDSLLEHLQSHVGLWPAVAEDVFVERLAAADAEGEVAVEQDLRGGRGLGDDGGVNADGRAGDGRRHRQADAGARESADHAPDERRLALLAVPRVVVVGDPEPVEPGPFGGARLSYQLRRSIFLTRQEEAQSHPLRVPPFAVPNRLEFAEFLKRAEGESRRPPSKVRHDPPAASRRTQVTARVCGPARRACVRWRTLLLSRSSTVPRRSGPLAGQRLR